MRLGILQEVAGRDMDVNQQLRERLVDLLGQERFDLWVGHHARFSRDGQVVRVMSATRFRLDQLRKSIHSELLEAARQLLGPDIGLDYIAQAPQDGAGKVEEGGSSTGSPVPSHLHPSSPAPTLPAPGRSSSAARSTGDRQFSTPHTTGTARPASSSPGSGRGQHRAPRPTAAGAVRAEARTVTLAESLGAGATAPSAPALRVVDGASAPESLADARRRRRPFAKLQDFVVGPCNQLTSQAVQLVSSNLGEFNPLVIHGPSGCGKTHLLEGIWSATREKFPFRRAVYLSAEQFTTYFVEALRGKGLASFRHKYRNVDLLIIDDVHFFAGKKATIVELLYTVDQLTREGAQLVFASDRSPAELAHLGDELVNRLMSGLVCSMEPLDLETRTELARRWAAQRQLQLEPGVLNAIVSDTQGDARRLAGALNMLMVAQQQAGRSVDLSTAQRHLGRLFPVQQRPIHLADVERAVCELFGIEPAQLRSEGRGQALTQPRMVAMWLARKHTRAALSEIGSYFGRRSHSSVVSAQTKVQSWLEQERIIQAGSATQPIGRMISQLENRIIG